MNFNWLFTKFAELPSPVSWIANGIELRHSRIEGTGLFANRPFKVGEIVMVLGGKLFSADEVKQGKAMDQSITGYAEGFYIGKLNCQTPFIDDYLNHSCDPNLWLEGRVSLLARKQIFANDEITADYSTWEIDEGWILPGRCNCGSRKCRSAITGRDWRAASFQERYKGHLLPCLARRIG